MAVLEKVEQYLASNLVSTSEAADSVVSVLEVDTKNERKNKEILETYDKYRTGRESAAI